jgi:2-iminoacetate synthase ThiH
MNVLSHLQLAQRLSKFSDEIVVVSGLHRLESTDQDYKDAIRKSLHDRAAEAVNEHGYNIEWFEGVAEISQQDYDDFMRTFVGHFHFASFAFRKGEKYEE